MRPASLDFVADVGGVVYGQLTPLGLREQLWLVIGGALKLPIVIHLKVTFLIILIDF